MKKVFLLTFLLSFTFTVKAQSFLSLDSCRALALANNKDLLISNEKNKYGSLSTESCIYKLFA